MLENDPLRHMELPRALTHSRLFRENSARRLFKARHLELEQFTIRTQIVSVASEENVAPVTVYLMNMQSHHPRAYRRSSSIGSDTPPWVLERRFSDFYAFRKRFLWLIKQWEALADDEEKATKEFMAMSNALRRPYTHDFPRRHFRVDTVKIIEERRLGLENFVRKLLTVYVDVSVYLLECVAAFQRTETSSCVYMAALCRELELFLDVPESQKEMERCWTAAIRCLTDIDEVDANATKPEDDDAAGADYECCICMNSGDAEQEEEETEQELARLEQLPGDDKLVQLPCKHQFHEDCVIDWFSTSMTCPLCRQQVIEPSERPSN